MANLWWEINAWVVSRFAFPNIANLAVSCHIFRWFVFLTLLDRYRSASHLNLLLDGIYLQEFGRVSGCRCNGQTAVTVTLRDIYETPVGQHGRSMFPRPREWDKAAVQELCVKNMCHLSPILSLQGMMESTPWGFFVFFSQFITTVATAFVIFAVWLRVVVFF